MSLHSGLLVIRSLLRRLAGVEVRHVYFLTLCFEILQFVFNAVAVVIVSHIDFGLARCATFEGHPVGVTACTVGVDIIDAK